MVQLYKVSIVLIFSLAALVFIVLFFVSAPYGKFLRKGWGPSIPAKWAWLIMELPSPVLMVFFFITGRQKDVPQVIFLTLWLSHYLYRTFIYPFSQSGRRKPYPLMVAGMAFVFNILNGFVNGYGIFHYAIHSFSWIMVWQFNTGFCIFVAGFVINKIADEKYRRMRMNNNGGYVKPEGWLFRYISSPHYFGEIVEWGGWAVMTWSLPGLAFAVFTFANLFPRAWASHNWYRNNFPGYPESRKAVIPFII